MNRHATFLLSLYLALAPVAAPLAACQGQLSTAIQLDRNVTNLSVDAAGNFYTYDPHLGVTKFTPGGSPMMSCCGPYGLAFTRGLVVRPDGSFVVIEDRVSESPPTRMVGHVVGYSSDGTEMTSWATEGTLEGVAVDQEGNVYVTEPDSDRVSKFSSSGQLLGRWGTWGSLKARYR
jgi:sugar lactone lactonase YvrE